jgi:GTPase SAR1 family protein
MIILEGTDAVGKTSVINNLKEYDFKDRDKNICSLIDFKISLIDRVNKLNEYLKRINDMVIFLINNDKSELERRIYLRDIIDEYDKYTYLYNLLYLETYTYMEQNGLLEDKLYMVDCTGLNIDEESEAVKRVIENAKYSRAYGSSK